MGENGQKSTFFYHRATALVGLLIIEDSRSHTDTPHSVGLLWTSHQLVTETSDNTQHSQETDIHAPGGIWTHNPSKREAAGPRLRPCGHWRKVRTFTLFSDFNKSKAFKRSDDALDIQLVKPGGAIHSPPSRITFTSSPSMTTSAKWKHLVKQCINSACIFNVTFFRGLF